MKLPLRSLGIFSSTAPARVASRRARCPLRSVIRAASALIAPGADRVRGLDQLLEHQAHRVAHQLSAAVGAESLPQLLCGRIRKELCFSPRITPMAPLVVDPRGYPQSPPLGGTLPTVAMTVAPTTIPGYPPYLAAPTRLRSVISD